MKNNRRDFLRISGMLGLGGLAGSLMGEQRAETLETYSGLLEYSDNKFTLPKLPYAYDALEPFIDKQSMEIHHTKHHQGYTDKINSARQGEIDFKLDDADKCRKVDKGTSALVRNNLGGYYNHKLFWEMMKPNPDGAKNLPSGKLADAINGKFGSAENFMKEFAEKAGKIFGSGWCWLIVDKKDLKITTTPNQDNPLMKVAEENGTPVLGIDVWEHAYYLKYQNKRGDYISNWWNVVNWEKASELFEKG